MFPIRKVLHPTDFSEASRPAFELACSITRDSGAQLMICHVAAPGLIAVGEGMVVEIPASEIDALTSRLEQMKPTDPRTLTTYRLLRGENAAEKILELASKSKVDLIVMGTHGRSGIKRLVVGSVAEAVLRNAQCPVLTVKPSPTSRRPKESPEPDAA